MWNPERSTPARGPWSGESLEAPNLYRILMYSYDTFGLGHIRRTLAIARSLRKSPANILILTGSPWSAASTSRAGWISYGFPA